MRRLLLMSLVLLLGCPSLFAQKSNAEAAMIAQAVNQVVSGKKFTFVANRILTSGASQSSLQNLNTVKITKDTLRVNLPYAGKGSNSSDLGSSNRNPLQFVSSDFTYNVSVNKRGEKVVTMEVVSPIGTDRYTFVFTITDAAVAKLSITGGVRSNMDFSGYIQDNESAVK